MKKKSRINKIYRFKVRSIMEYVGYSNIMNTKIKAENTPAEILERFQILDTGSRVIDDEILAMFLKESGMESLSESGDSVWGKLDDTTTPEEFVYIGESSLSGGITYIYFKGVFDIEIEEDEVGCSNEVCDEKQSSNITSKVIDNSTKSPDNKPLIYTISVAGDDIESIEGLYSGEDSKLRDANEFKDDYRYEFLVDMVKLKMSQGTNIINNLESYNNLFNEIWDISYGGDK